MAWFNGGDWSEAIVGRDLKTILAQLCYATNEREANLGRSKSVWTVASGTKSDPAASDFAGLRVCDIGTVVGELRTAMEDLGTMANSSLVYDGYVYYSGAGNARSDWEDYADHLFDDLAESDWVDFVRPQDASVYVQLKNVLDGMHLAYMGRGKDTGATSLVLGWDAGVDSGGSLSAAWADLVSGGSSSGSGASFNVLNQAFWGGGYATGTDAFSNAVAIDGTVTGLVFSNIVPPGTKGSVAKEFVNTAIVFDTQFLPAFDWADVFRINYDLTYTLGRGKTITIPASSGKAADVPYAGAIADTYIPYYSMSYLNTWTDGTLGTGGTLAATPFSCSVGVSGSLSATHPWDWWNAVASTWDEAYLGVTLLPAGWYAIVESAGTDYIYG